MPESVKYNFGALTRAFGGIVEPRRQQSDHKGAFQDVKIAFDGLMGHAKGLGQFGIIQCRPMIMTQHHPKTPQGLRRDCDAQLGNISL